MKIHNLPFKEYSGKVVERGKRGSSETSQEAAQLTTGDMTVALTQMVVVETTGR